MESKAGSKFLFCRASYRKTASHFSGRTLAVSLRFGHATEKPIKAYVKRISDKAKTVKWKMDRSDVEITASVCGKACSLRDFPRGQSLRSACIVKSGRKQRQIRHELRYLL
jgi:hypothetical protein